MATSARQLDVFCLLYSTSLLIMSLFAFGQMLSNHHITVHGQLDWNELRVLSIQLFFAMSLFVCFIYTFPSIHRAQSSGVEIPRVTSWIPWLGHAFQYSFDNANFLISCRQRYGTVFKFQVGGTNVVAISQPTAVVNLLRSTKTDVVDFQMLPYFAGFKDHSRMPIIWSMGSVKAMTIVGSRLSPRHLVSSSTTFNLKLYELVGEAAARADGGGGGGNSEVAIGIADFVRRSMFVATSFTFMGPHFLEEDLEKAYRDYVVYDDGAMCLVQRLPFRRGKMKATRARERQVEKMIAFLKQYWCEEDGGHIEGAAGSFMSTVVASMKKGELTEDEIARLQFVFLWGSYANLSQVCIWVLHHLLAGPEMFAGISGEHGMLNGRFANVTALLHADPRELEKTFPLLTSAIQECLRLVSLPASARQVTEDIDILGEDNRPIRIHKGEIILADVLNMHLNDKHFEEPSVFKYDRFVNRGDDSSAQSKAFLPFGAGFHKCAGRHFVVHAIRMFIILCFHFYDFSPSSKENNSLPPVDPTSFLTIVRPQEDRLIVLRRRLVLPVV